MSKEWTPPEDAKIHIVCAACRAINMLKVMVIGPRHFDSTMQQQVLMLDEIYGTGAIRNWEQGFIDQFGRFYTRKEAMLSVIGTHQPFNFKRNGSQLKELYSEGLY